MSFNVRVFGHRGLDQIPIVLPKQFTADAVFQLTQPYVWAQTLVAGASAVSSSPDNTEGVNTLRIEIPDGQSIRYEINPPNRTGGVVDAGTQSPILSGQNQFYFRPGWSISIIDASSLP